MSARAHNEGSKLIHGANIIVLDVGISGQLALIHDKTRQERQQAITA